MDDLARLTFSNLKDPNQEGIYLTDSSTEATFNKILRAINTITENKNVWASAYSKNEKSGYMERSVFVPKASLEALMARLSSLQAELQAKDTGFNFQADRNIKTLSTDITLTGANALNKASMRARELGGSFDRATGQLQLPLSKKTYESITSGGTETAYVANQFREAHKISAETFMQREEAKREREAEKAMREEAKREAKSQKTNAWFKSEGERAAAKEYQEKLDKSKQKEEDDKENKKENFLSSFLKDPLVKILTFFGLTVSLLRRIILNMPKQAVELAKETQKNDVLTGLALGLTKRQLRDFKIFETAHGLEEGTFAGAVKEVNETFGRIDKLENDSVQIRNMARLGTAAYGAKGSGKANEFIEKLVTMELTQEQPDVLLGTILDAAFTAYANRKDILTGETVSSEASMRSILSHLEEAGFQDAAVLFLQEIWDKESDYYEPFGDYSSWLKTTKTDVTDLPDEYLDVLTLVSQQFNDIAATLKEVVDAALTRFAASLVKIADWIEEQDWLLSPEEKLFRNQENIEKNKEQAAKYEASMAYTEQSFRARYEKVTGKAFTGEMGKGLPTEIFEDAQLVADWAVYLDYANALKDVNKEIEQGKAGKKVSYHKGQHDARYRRLMAQKQLDLLYAKFQEGVIDLPEANIDLHLADRKDISQAEAELIQRSFDWYKASTDISFAKPEGMSPEDYKKAIKKNKVMMKILDLYNQHYEAKGKAKVTPDNLLSGTNLSAVQSFWNSLSTEDQALALESIARMGGDAGKIAQSAVYAGRKEVSQPAKSVAEQKQVFNDLFESYGRDTAALLKAVNAPAGSTIQGYKIWQSPDSRHAVVDINIKTPEGKVQTKSLELEESTTGMGWVSGKDGFMVDYAAGQ